MKHLKCCIISSTLLLTQPCDLVQRLMELVEFIIWKTKCSDCIINQLHANSKINSSPRRTSFSFYNCFPCCIDSWVRSSSERGFVVQSAIEPHIGIRAYSCKGWCLPRRELCNRRVPLSDTYSRMNFGCCSLAHPLYIWTRRSNSGRCRMQERVISQSTKSMFSTRKEFLDAHDGALRDSVKVPITTMLNQHSLQNCCQSPWLLQDRVN